MKKINAEDLYLKLLLFFPVSTLFQGIPALDWINKVLFIATFVLQLSLQFNSFKIKVKWIPFIGLNEINHLVIFSQPFFILSHHQYSNLDNNKLSAMYIISHRNYTIHSSTSTYILIEFNLNFFVRVYDKSTHQSTINTV